MPKDEHFFVLFMDANARTGPSGRGGSEECEVLGAYGGDTLDDHGERPLAFLTSHSLTLLQDFLQHCQERTFAYVERPG